ncbi:hypothetical protein PanNE5_32290 [Pandoraea sp. NE5]|nr:hypothetical protein PanNE5_32290 [Pandoraea sp. NE5]
MQPAQTRSHSRAEHRQVQPQATAPRQPRTQCNRFKHGDLTAADMTASHDHASGTADAAMAIGEDANRPYPPD